jgi:hypothetical protein
MQKSPVSICLKMSLNLGTTFSPVNPPAKPTVNSGYCSLNYE